MKRYVGRSIIFIGVSFLVGCESIQEGSIYKQNYRPTVSKPLLDPNNMRKVLYSHYDEWQGVRYKYGGLSRQGIDCSGFVHLTFKSKLGMNLPRTTWMQAKIGQEIRQNDLRVGDLVFFKTGKTSNHVGIYLEKNKFLHASQKKGVTISRLDHIYWRSNYWKSVRI
ncbi:lipoprotein Spr/probable lipoprotein NlpC [Nitrosomonas ureae]|uniref:Lipoprotein Spr/probable lipoprotein NlpC n=1 Tax=Nitrosomonas ureae TaxID=44577 RepID=A0A285BUX2_9PROT|nr:NlpC/P60 family protein [Nitrosomonas ureae]SNX59091.1 lipoprotein Spr/probable lipoprotein NlpC [Nitrosomonas ureae]